MDSPGTSPPASAVLLVCAIAEPGAFEENARAAGAEITARAFFADHHDYTAADAAAILDRTGNGTIVTTAKDWVKLGALLPPERVWVLHQEIEPEDGSDALVASVRAVLG